MSDHTVLIVEDDPALLEALRETLSLAGLQVAVAEDGARALEVMNRTEVDLVVSDVQMSPMDGREMLKHMKARQPELPVLLMTAYGTVEKAVDAMRYGASDYLEKPFDVDVLLAKVRRYLPSTHADTEGLLAVDPITRDLMGLAGRFAGSDATIMITGESGTGKEVFARFIHRHSVRNDGPFVAINCAAIPENMLEAVLFGYEKGAFTGAHAAYPGKFEQAQGGTLLLDEISEMDLGLQAKLLRVVQEREVERLGARKTLALDLRILATTNRVLRDEVAAGRFREDLYYRLNVLPLHVPALRSRPGDIVPLARFMLERACRARPVPALTPAAQERLNRHSWPGNVRELENLIQRSVILSSGDSIDADDLRFESLECSASTTEVEPGERSPRTLGDELKEREHERVVQALQAVHGSRKRAAELLGISPRTLRYKLARMREASVRLPGESGANFA